jgi:hypothetical protein
MENRGIFYDHLVYFMAVGNISWPFGTFCVRFVHFLQFWYHVPIKIWQVQRLLRALFVAHFGGSGLASTLSAN